MVDQRMLSPETVVLKPRKKKPSMQKASMLSLQGEMVDQRMLSPETVVSKPRKKKPSMQKASMHPLQGENIKKLHLQALPFQMMQKPSKRGLVNEDSAVLPQPDKSTSDLMADSSPSSGNDYRALRRKYLLLEEDSFRLGRELKVAEDEIKALEEEKLLLLDELVVLEGLIDHLDVPKASE